ncbi:MAG: hypothetical protein O2788_06150 [Chloroflexi bacterium]|nr:hypothetical protein [Chloroflexota bacterium]
MPPQQRKRSRRDRHVNVFVQETAPTGREEYEAEDATAVADEDEAAAGQQAAVVRQRRIRAQRVARQTRVRSEVFTRLAGKELRKMGVLTGGMMVVLIVLSFVM